MDAERDFVSFAASLLGVDPAPLSSATVPADLPEWDSVMHLRLVMETEAKYGVSIPIEDVPGLTSFAGFISLIEAGGR